MISIVVPVFNEKDNLKKLLLRIKKSFSGANQDYEIVFIDDHSTDGTWQFLQKAKKDYPVKIFAKVGQKGKAFSLVEGFKKASGEVLAMIDADLQYPPEAIPEMVEALENADVVVANRKNYHHSKVRKFISRTFKLLFGKGLFGLDTDIQSGLKAFKREVWETVKFTPKSQWTFDLEFLHRAKEAGFEMRNHDITFHPRKNGDSKLKLFKTAWEIGTNALALKAKKIGPQIINPAIGETMHGAGVGYKKHKFITHTTLSLKKSALITLTNWQRLFIISMLTLIAAAAYYFGPKQTAIGAVAVLTSIYFADVLFNAFLITRSLKSSPEISFTNDELSTINDKQLPTYTVLCPLYKEASVLRQFAQGIEDLDWPKDKLEVLLLLEEDDKETQDAARFLHLPSYFKTVIVPLSNPKTKPKACNYGLHLATGKHLVIYDAEDKPDPLQLKKAYLGFVKYGSKITCFQAKLNYYNTNHNFLTKFFTAEFSLWFGLILTGLQSLDTTIPLGGTSNHFRTETLRKLEGWDPFNVTEDCDLGVRLFKDGYRTAIIDSTTLEEANSKIGNWLRQRSRWIKGYMQTFLVHNRDFPKFVKSSKHHSAIFQLVVGGKIAFIMINPFMWLTTIVYFALRPIVGPTIEQFFPTSIFYMAAFCLVAGNFLYLYYYMIALVKHEKFDLIKYVLFIPIYWAMISTAFWMAAYQLIFKPHYWEKTIHGFHLAKAESDLAKAQQDQIKAELRVQKGQDRQRRLAYIHALARSGMATGGALIAASIFANFMNFAYNAYLGRRISVEDFGLVSLVGSFFYLSTIPVGALAKTVTHRTAFLLGKYEIPLKQFWSHVRLRAMLAGTAATLIWLAAIPVLSVFFKSPSYAPFILFAPVWFIGVTAVVDYGFLSGNLKFKVLAILVIIESLAKFMTAFILVETGNPHFVYAATPIAMAAAFLVGWFFVTRIKQEKKIIDSQTLNFPKKFFVTSVFTKFSTVAFLSFDLILAKLFLPPQEAGLYALISLTGKMVFFSGSLFSSFINPLVSKEEGAHRKSHKVFYKLFFASIFLSFCAYLAVGLFGAYTVPLLLGEKVGPILYLLPIYGLAMFCFSIAHNLVTYYQIRRKYLFSIVSLFLAFAQILAIYFYHADLEEIVIVITATGITSLVVTVILYLIYEPLFALGRNLIDFLGVVTFSTPKVAASPANLRILIFNWRDTKHVWGGGAETYIHEIAKRLVQQGNSVTIFCGNDRKSLRNETIDGIQIIRRGGFYTVYAWAFLYYIFRFRGDYDIIVDSENGIPFFTPLYVRKPVIGLIHHVHQEVFRTKLKFPLAQIGKFLEGKVMPIVYRNVRMVTVSNSSREDMQKIGLGKKLPIEIVHPGVDLTKFKPAGKTEKPSIIYLGRLKPYKSIETIISVMVTLIKKIPNVSLTIAGEGESRVNLEAMVKTLHLERHVRFLGRVSEVTKRKLLAQSWVMVQPSMVEGWGITVIEANACGTPVIASDVPGLRDSVKNPHSGLLVTWDNKEKWTNAVVNVLTDNKQRNELTEFAKSWAQEFSWEVSTEKLSELIGRDLKKKGKNSRSQRL